VSIGNNGAFISKQISTSHEPINGTFLTNQHFFLKEQQIKKVLNKLTLATSGLNKVTINS
jgi:hypothetical protein